MLQLMTNHNGEWNLVNGPEFTEEELKPFNLEAAGLAVLPPNFSVKVPWFKVSKDQVLAVLRHNNANERDGRSVAR